MALPTVITGYLALGSALASNYALTELASSNGYARISVLVQYDVNSGDIFIQPGVSFLPSGAWSSATYMGLFDAATGGNCLMVWQIPSVTGASGVPISYAGGTFNMNLTGFPSSKSIAAGTVLGTIMNLSGAVLASNVVNPVALTFNGTTLAATAPAQTVALTDGATIATDCSTGAAFSVTFAGNRTLSNPTNAVAGQTYRWFITQDGTGSRTLTLGSKFKTAGGTPTLTTTAAATDRYTAYYDGATFWGILEKAFA